MRDAKKMMNISLEAGTARRRLLQIEPAGNARL
jgi:hypothetical protein